MPTILAVDTSTDACSVALLKNRQVIEKHTLTPRQHTQKLLPLIDELLSEQNVKLLDLDAIAYGRGPGSFTGLRICMGTVQGLAYAAELPLIAVSTLETLATGAQRLYRFPEGSHLVVALDARMNEVYWAAYKIQQGQATAITEEFVMPPAKVIDVLEEFDIKNLHGIGSGWHYHDLKVLVPEQVIETINPMAVDILPLAEQAREAGLQVTAEQAQPIYLRDSVAWEKRKRIRGR